MTELIKQGNKYKKLLLENLNEVLINQGNQIKQMGMMPIMKHLQQCKVKILLGLEDLEEKMELEMGHLAGLVTAMVEMAVLEKEMGKVA